MRWHLKASEKVGNGNQTRREWVQKLRDDGIDTTGLLDEEPDIFEDLIPYWIAFQVLTSSRNSGMGLGAIPLPAYESYFRIMGIDSLEERLEYIYFVGILDHEFLKWNGEQHEKESKKNKSKSAPKGRTTAAKKPRK
jgi:hypothetical protein